MLVLLATALAWSPLDAPSLPSAEDYGVCEPAVLDPVPIEMVFVERVFVEARACPVDDPCCAVGGFAWWEPEQGPAMRLLQAPGCAADACGECGFDLTAVGQRERVCRDGVAKTVFRPQLTVTTPREVVPQAFPDRVVWVLFPGMPGAEYVGPSRPAPGVFAVRELEIPDARDAEQSVAGP